MLKPLSEIVDFLPDVTNWEECKKWYENTSPGHFIFRGVSSSQFPLETSFDIAYRQNVENSATIPKWKYEAVMLLNFKRIAHQYIDSPNLPRQNDNLEWLGLLRHYGAPSRLLDFTYSFYNAVYFAIAKIDKNKKNDSAVVWAIDLDWLAAEAYKLRARNQIDDNIFQDPELFNNIVMNPEFIQNSVIPINPFRFNRRMHLQKGIFLCPGNIDNTFEQNLVDVPEIDMDKIFKIKLKNEEKKLILKDFERMNISYETLYGDLEGVALSLYDFFSLDHRLMTNNELLYHVMGINLKSSF